jgi:hypothetical protein
MWFARFFGGRKVEADEPARFAPPQSAKTVQPARRVQGKLSHASAKPTGATVKKPPARKDPGGFDPYNSGAFDKGNAWERVIRR